MDTTELARQAIQAALHGNWNEAIALNKEILITETEDTDALNRLARAYAECGDLTKAKQTAAKVLKLNPADTIASRAILKWKGLKAGTKITSGTTTGELFLEEPGKTKIIPLLCLGDKSQLSKLCSGEEVKMAPHGHRVSITTVGGKYIGRLPDDLSAKLRLLMKNGYEYQVLIKSLEPDDVKIFIKETNRSSKMGDLSSFSAEKIDYISFTPPELVTKREMVSPDLEFEENN